jgi:hypothetical protein
MQLLRQSTRRLDTERVKEKVEAFGQPDHNPVRDQISELRKQRDAGSLSMTDYALTVAELLGAIEPGA